MQYSIKSGSAARTKTACAIAGVYESKQLSVAASELDKASKRRVRRALSKSAMTGKPGETLMLSALPGLNCGSLLLVGLGPRERFGLKQYRHALNTAGQAANRAGARDAVSLLGSEAVPGLDARGMARHAVESIAFALYRYTRTKSKNGPEPSLQRFAMLVDKSVRAETQQGADDGEAIAAGVELARELGNLPSNICTPSYLASIARDLAENTANLSAKILNEAQIKRLGMGAFLSVTQGSHEPPRLIVLEYAGGPKGEAPTALVGKGVTFDTGGICIKPAPSMDEMKYDMCGAASVLGTMAALARLQLPINVVGIVPAAENMPGGKASRPGDVVETMSGKTVEILNTDAEGRLLLCDAITYAQRFQPAAIVDIATLTGACVIALGACYSGLMSNDQPLADELLDAGRRAGDQAWQLPLDEDYAALLKTNFADLANVGGRPAGAITAGCFLQEFAGDARWAHIDIAGTAWRSGKAKGGTGRPVSLLAQYLMDRT